MTTYLASGWRREVNEEYNRNDVRDRDGDIVCVVWDDGDGSFTVQGWNAEWEQCEEDDSHNFATLTEAEAEVARRVAEFEAGGDTCDDCARSYGPNYGACRCGND